MYSNFKMIYFKRKISKNALHNGLYSLSKKSVEAKCYVYLLTVVFIKIYSLLYQKVSYHFLWKKFVVNWILCIKSTDFQRQISAYKFQVFFTNNIILVNLPKELYDTSEICNIVNLIYKDILYFVWNNFYRLSNVYLAS